MRKYFQCSYNLKRCLRQKNMPATYSYSQSKLVYNLVAQLRCVTDQACLRHGADHAAVTAARACSAVWCLATVASHGPYPAAPGRCRSAPARQEIKWWHRSTRILNCMRKTIDVTVILDTFCCATISLKETQAHTRLWKKRHATMQVSMTKQHAKYEDVIWNSNTMRSSCM